jgi:hypothetical protein
MAVTTLHHFTFSNGTIFELKFNDLSNKADKCDKFQWYMILDDYRYKLTFCTMTPTTRGFGCGDMSVELDMEKNTLKIDDHYNNKKHEYTITMTL